MARRAASFAAALVFVAGMTSPAAAAPSSGPSLGEGITVLAGIGEQGPAKDGAPAAESPLNNVTGIAVAPDGTVYLADSGSRRVRAVGADGILRTVAGTGQDGTNAPAPNGKVKGTDVAFGDPGELAVGPDGTLFIGDAGTIRVYALAPDGTLSVRADQSTGRGVLPAPMGAPTGLAVGPDGTLYVADRTNYLVFALAPDGSVRIAAGGVGGGVAGSSGPATETQIGPVTGITVDAAGDLWISSASSLMRVHSGTLAPVREPVDGTWELVVTAEQQNDKPLASFTTVSAGRDGVYILDYGAKAIRRLTPDHRVRAVGPLPDTDRSILWAAAASAPNGPVYLSDNRNSRVLAARVAPVAAEPAPDRTEWWPYAAGAMLLVAVVTAGWWIRRRRAPSYQAGVGGIDHG
ncbi:hypothetical protein L3i22_092690 [Actinoplanes sp. L3-i22]|nr:hypothetical protein L3i22_092690 [Actinoplanes sp. L3-i22]